MKKKMILMTVLLALILLSGGLVIAGNHAANQKENRIVFTGRDLADFETENDDVRIRLAPRGVETGENATWDYYAETKDENGNDIVIPYIGTIYELSVTNLTDDTVSSWDFRLDIPEQMYFNSGWNGFFDIHQFNDGKERSQCFSNGKFDMTGSELEYTDERNCLLIPMKEGDYFTYVPVEASLEVPLAPSDLKHDTMITKTIGFIMYFRDKDISYVTDFSEGYFSYHMYRSLWHEKLFYVVAAALLAWIMGFIEMLVLHIQTRKLIRQHKRGMKIIEESMSTFINFIDAKDPNTKGHSVRVAQYSKMLAEKYGLSKEKCEDIYYIALMHDCGKISIPQEILTKPGRLNDEEYAIMKSHSEKGYKMLEKFTSLPDVGLGAYCHHERYDGRGYPQGLKGEEIPLIGRIICIADSFDAMNSKRCYREKMPREKIISELKDNKGKQFDPQLLDCFMSLIEKEEIKF